MISEYFPYFEHKDKDFSLRLKDLLLEKYGKKIKVIPNKDTDNILEKDIFIKGNNLHISLSVNGEILGVAIIYDGKYLNDDEKNEVQQIVRLVLEPALYRFKANTSETERKIILNKSEVKRKIKNL